MWYSDLTLFLQLTGWCNTHLKNSISIWQHTAAGGRNIAKQWVRGYIKWKLNSFGFRWIIRVRTKHVFSRLLEMAITAQNGTSPIIRAKQGWVILVSLMTIFIRRCHTSMLGKSSQSTTWRLNSAQKLIWHILKT